MADKKERRGLGRGLSALMADVATSEPEKPEVPRRPDSHIAIDKITANPDQPRRRFKPEALEDLARSIREKGILQPLILRPDPNTPGQYQIVAGERRWRAAQMAQLHKVPALIRDFDDTEVLEVAIIENIQRSDLNPIEEAAGFRQLMDRFGHTQDKLAEALGKSRSHIANTLRLLNLPEDVRTLLEDGKLSAGHARALLTAEDPLALARDVVAKGLSVRETEKLAKGRTTKGSTGKASHSSEKDADTRALENDLMAALRMGVSIDHKGPGGAVTIRYKSLDQLDEFCQKVSAVSQMSDLD